MFSPAMAAAWTTFNLPVFRAGPLIDCNRRPSLRLSRRRVMASVRKEEIVIVGAGIAGLATAVSLNRLGVRSLVLEQGDSLRTGGTSLTLFKNAWRILDAIGAGEELRPQFLEIEGLAMRSTEGKLLRTFTFKEVDPSQEVRAVERKVLLETLASRLPTDSIHFSSKLVSISQRDQSSGTLLELEDGTQIQAKVVIGCDGVRSPVAKWMGFSEPKFVGHCAFRGLGVYPEGHLLEPKVNYVYGRGIRAGYVPVSPTKVYWFICFNSSDPGAKVTDPLELKREAAEMVANWPPELGDAISKTPDGSVLRTPLADRWLWPLISPPGTAGGVVVAGDSWHPMTPNLGQGACCALEDAAVLARKLAFATTSGSGGSSVEKALVDFCSERWKRVFPLTIRSHLVGSLLQWENPVVCTVRDKIVIPKLVMLGPVLEHTNFSVDFTTVDQIPKVKSLCKGQFFFTK